MNDDILSAVRAIFGRNVYIYTDQLQISFASRADAIDKIGRLCTLAGIDSGKLNYARTNSWPLDAKPPA